MQQKKKWSLTILLFAFVIVCFAIAAIPALRNDSRPSPDGNLQLHFLNVGQGDSTLILCDGHAMLIDGGDLSSSRKVYTYLKDLNVRHLDYIIATHPHDDHTGGLSGALNFADAETALSPVAEADCAGFRNFLKYLNEKNIPITVPRPGESYALGSAKFVILAPTHLTDDWNNSSIVLRLTYGDYHALFTGDAELQEEQDLLSSRKQISANVLKVGHHGGNDASGADFLDAVSPRIAVISCGAGNEYGHPSRQTLLRLESVGASVLRTDQMGDIVISVQPNGFYSIQSTVMGSKTDIPVSPKEITYIVNTGSGKFHLPDCSSADEITPSHRMEFTGTREDLISMGYEPCGRCKP